MLEHQPGHQGYEGYIKNHKQYCSRTQADRACHIVSVQEHQTAQRSTRDYAERQDLQHDPQHISTMPTKSSDIQH